MRWTLSNRADPLVKRLADRHYNRQNPDSAQFVPPGRCLVLLADDLRAMWVTSWPLPEFVKHRWPGAWVCSAFRNEGSGLSSDLILEAVSVTQWRYGVPANLPGMVTFVDAAQVRRKRDPGRCFLRAGFQPAGSTKGGLLAFFLPPDLFPGAEPPRGSQSAFHSDEDAE